MFLLITYQQRIHYWNDSYKKRFKVEVWLQRNAETKNCKVADISGWRTGKRRISWNESFEFFSFFYFFLCWNNENHVSMLIIRLFRYFSLLEDPKMSALRFFNLFYLRWVFGIKNGRNNTKEANKKRKKKGSQMAKRINKHSNFVFVLPQFRQDK